MKISLIFGLILVGFQVHCGNASVIPIDRSVNDTADVADENCELDGSGDSEYAGSWDPEESYSYYDSLGIIPSDFLDSDSNEGDEVVPKDLDDPDSGAYDSLDSGSGDCGLSDDDDNSDSYEDSYESDSECESDSDDSDDSYDDSDESCDIDESSSSPSSDSYEDCEVYDDSTDDDSTGTEESCEIYEDLSDNDSGDCEVDDDSDESCEVYDDSTEYDSGECDPDSSAPETETPSIITPIVDPTLPTNTPRPPRSTKPSATRPTKSSRKTTR